VLAGWVGSGIDDDFDWFETATVELDWNRHLVDTGVGRFLTG
jgi:hypothetical protein